MWRVQLFLGGTVFCIEINISRCLSSDISISRDKNKTQGSKYIDEK